MQCRRLPGEAGCCAWYSNEPMLFENGISKFLPRHPSAMTAAAAVYAGYRSSNNQRTGIWIAIAGVCVYVCVCAYPVGSLISRLEAFRISSDVIPSIKEFA